MTAQDDRDEFEAVTGFNTGYYEAKEEEMRRILAAIQASPPSWWQRRSKKASRKYMTELLDALEITS